jgi:hypothetical protein
VVPAVVVGGDARAGGGGVAAGGARRWAVAAALEQRERREHRQRVPAAKDGRRRGAHGREVDEDRREGDAERTPERRQRGTSRQRVDVTTARRAPG